MTATFTFLGHHLGSLTVRMHAHAENELIVLQRGGCRIALDGQDHLLGPGDGLLIPAGEEHDQRDLEHCDCYYLKFIGTSDGLPISCRRLDHDDELIPRWCRDLGLLQHGNEQRTCDAMLGAILERLAQRERARAQAALLPPALDKALRWIDDHYPDELSTEELAMVAGVSGSHLNLLFRRHCGHSPGAQLLAVRMRHARRLLRDDYRSINEVAAAVGLPDPNYFARRFRREHGCSPRAWRQRSARRPG